MATRARGNSGKQGNRLPRHVRRWGAVYLLCLLFIGSWIGQFFTQMAEFAQEQTSHGEAFVWSDFLASFGSATFENWQSEWLQLIFQAILLMGAKHLLFRTDAADMERLEEKIDELRAEVGLADTPPHDPQDAIDERRDQAGR